MASISDIKARLIEHSCRIDIERVFGGTNKVYVIVFDVIFEDG